MDWSKEIKKMGHTIRLEETKARTVAYPGIGTGISEASKRVPISMSLLTSLCNDFTRATYPQTPLIKMVPIGPVPIPG